MIQPEKLLLQLVVLCCGYVVSAALLAATAYKCVDETGATNFSDTPCKGVPSEQIYIHENFTEGESLSPEELKMLEEIEAREKQLQIESQPEQPLEKENIPATTQAKPVIDKKECKKATDNLNQWKKVMSLGYPPEESEYYQQEYNYKIEAQKKSCGLAE